MRSPDTRRNEVAVADGVNQEAGSNDDLKKFTPQHLQE